MSIYCVKLGRIRGKIETNHKDFFKNGNYLETETLSIKNGDVCTEIETLMATKILL